MHAQSNPETLAEAIDRLESHLEVNAANGHWHLAPTYNPNGGYVATAFVPVSWGSPIVKPLGPGNSTGTVEVTATDPAAAMSTLADLVADAIATGRAA